MSVREEQIGGIMLNVLFLVMILAGSGQLMQFFQLFWLGFIEMKSPRMPKVLSFPV